MSAVVVTDQPEPQTRLLFGQSSTESTLRLARTTSRPTVQSSKLGIFGRQRNQSDASSRKMLISAPTDFRHLTSGSRHAFPAMPLSVHPSSEVLHAPPTREFLRIPGQSAPAHDWEPESRREGLRAFVPSELRTFRTQYRLAPLLPPFEVPTISPTPPPAYARDEAERSPVLHPQRSMPSLSCISTRATSESSSHSSGVSEWNSSPKRLTYATKSSKRKARSGSHTTPAVEVIRARVVTAMQEVERLQKKIDDVVERQNLYTPCRPSSAHSFHSLTCTLTDLEPMPSIPALPPSAPSFAERLHGEDGLSTGPANLSRRSNTNDGLGTKCTGSQRQACPPPLVCDKTTKAMPPPPSLVLRPPLRKKKPFSGRLSGFVFSEPPRESSLDCVAKIKDMDGFYRRVPDNGAHHSYESLHSMSTSNCGDNETPSQPSLYTQSPHEFPIPVERYATFGQEAKELRLSVGIAL